MKMITKSILVALITASSTLASSSVFADSESFNTFDRSGVFTNINRFASVGDDSTGDKDKDKDPSPDPCFPIVAGPTETSMMFRPSPNAKTPYGDIKSLGYCLCWPMC